MKYTRQELQDFYFGLNNPNRKIRDDITLKDVAEVVLLLANEATLLKREVSALKGRIQELEQH